MARRIGEMEKERLIDLIKAVLEADEKVIWAYVYGSFFSGDFFRDIDIGIYVKAPEDTKTAPSQSLLS